MASAITCGLILLGNSGVGKSFLANRLLDDDEAFESRFSARSVTRHTEWKNMSTVIGKHIYSVANIPGLVEANQKLIDENRREIMKAFEDCPFATVLFVFGHKNGRIPDEDLVAFMQINDAYQFPSKSLLLIINGIPSDRPNDYEERTAQLIQELTHVDKSHIYFIEKIISEESKNVIRHLLHEAVAKCEPSYQQKKHDIELVADEISRLKMESKQRQDQLLAQEYEYSKRQQLDSTRDPIQEVHRSRPHQSVTATTKPIPESIDHNRQFQKWMEDNQTKHEEYMASIEKIVHNPDTDAVIQLAQQLKNNSQQNSTLIAQMSVSPPVIIVSKKPTGRSGEKRTKAVERAVNFAKGVHFDKKKSTRIAGWVILILPVCIMSTIIHEPLYLELFVYDDKKVYKDDKQIEEVDTNRNQAENYAWCVTRNSRTVQHYSTAILFFHLVGPFVANLFSALLIIFGIARQHRLIKTNQSYTEHIFKQLNAHKNLVISPIILLVLSLPRLIISLLSGSVNVSRYPWLYLCGYFIYSFNTCICHFCHAFASL